MYEKGGKHMDRRYGYLKLVKTDVNDCYYPYTGWIATLIDRSGNKYEWLYRGSHPQYVLGMDYLYVGYTIIENKLGRCHIKNVRRKKI